VSDRTTKERILDAAKSLMLEKSFHSVGLSEILSTVKVPKGSFYHYFESKEQFGVELLKHYVAAASAYKRQMLLSPEVEPNPLLRLLTCLEANVAQMQENNGKCPCLAAKLSSEVADLSEPMREVLAEAQHEWSKITELLLREGIKKKQVNASIDPKRTAVVFNDLWTGAMMSSAIQRNVTPLREAIAYMKSALTPGK
jgi:TetR/AcrR family transcriptional repressor of nem operon